MPLKNTIIISEKEDNSLSTKALQAEVLQRLEQMKNRKSLIAKYDPETEKTEILTPGHPEYLGYGREKE